MKMIQRFAHLGERKFVIYMVQVDVAAIDTRIK